MSIEIAVRNCEVLMFAVDVLSVALMAGIFVAMRKAMRKCDTDVWEKLDWDSNEEVLGGIGTDVG